MNTYEIGTPHLGPHNRTHCPNCRTVSLAVAVMYVMVSTGPRAVGSYAVCENCGYSPYDAPDPPEEPLP